MKRTYKSIENLAKNVNQLTLENILHKRANFKNGGWESINDLMTERHAQQIANLLGGRNKTKQAIKRVLLNPIGVRGWFLDRIIYEPRVNNWIYCAGQDYPAELRQIRKELKN